MKVTVKKPVEVEVKYVRIDVPVRYGDEDMPYDFPFRRRDLWIITVDIDTGKILNWPTNIGDTKVYMNVCDEGTYIIYDGDMRKVAAIEEDYVPDLIPGEYGDYIKLNIANDGTITNWPKKPKLEEFFR